MADAQFYDFMTAAIPALKSKVPVDQKVHGVFILPVNVWQNRVYVSLGKQASGPNKGKWSLFGGRVEEEYQMNWSSLTEDQRIQVVAHTLQREVREEMGLKLDSTALTSSLIRVHTMQCHTGVNIVFVVRIEGYSPKAFDIMLEDRLKQDVHDCFKEHSALKCFAKGNVNGVSGFVKRVQFMFPSLESVLTADKMPRIVTTQGDDLESLQ